MLSNNLINYLKKEKIWSDEPHAPYRDALNTLGIPEDTDIGQFYLHAEDSPNFLSAKKGELLQVCWHTLNTRYIANSNHLRAALKIPEDRVILSSFEGEGGWVYDKASGKVYLLTLSKLKPGEQTTWETFGDFLDYYFNITSA